MSSILLQILEKLAILKFAEHLSFLGIDGDGFLPWRCCKTSCAHGFDDLQSSD